MTGRERVLAVLNGHHPDHRPYMPITMMFAADVLGVKYGQYIRDHKTMADAQIKTAELFGFDHVSTIAPTSEAVDLGAKFQWFDNQPPGIIEQEALLTDKSALSQLPAPDTVLGDSMEDRIRGVELLRRRVGNDLIVEGWVEGPCSDAADLRGINRLMVDFSDDAAFVAALFDYSVELATGFAAAQVEGGADVIGIGDPPASLVGPRIYKEQVWSWQKKLVDAIHAKGAKVRLHICGNTRRILANLGELGCDLVDVDSPVPMEQAREQFGPRQTLIGNLDPVREVRNGSPESIQQALEALQQKAGERWVVGAGCEIVRDTPHENMHTMRMFARSHTTAVMAT
ncbi:MAG: uroporphyrinogen decarboxylase family protein [Acidobacteriaceae bacterium]